MKNILFIGSFVLPENGHYGGVYFASTTLRDGLAKEGYSIIEMDTTLKDISEIRVYKRLPNILIRQFKFLYTITFNFKAKHILIFLSGGGSYIDKFFPILLAKLLRKRVIIFPRSGHLIRDFNKNKFNFFINRVFKYTDRVVCQSSFWKDYFISKNVNHNKLLVIENWVDDLKIEESKTLDYPKFKGKDKEKFKIVFVSRIEKAKGVDDIISLACKLKGKLNFAINVYGAGSYQKDFIDGIKSNQVEDVVHFKGWLEKDKMLETINNHHLAIFPSQTEGYPNSLLDYIFAKIPIIASDIPMVQAVGGENIKYFKQGNKDELAEKVLEIVNDYSICLKKAKNLNIEKTKRNNLKNALLKFNSLLNV